MLENLRRKSLTKTYNDPQHQVHFELGYARYENHWSMYQYKNQYKQKLSKKKIEPPFLNPFTQVSKEFRLFHFRLDAINFNMIFCPKGTFTMGHGSQKDNEPRTEIIDTPFLLGETEVTQELYEKVMNTNPSWFKNRPQNPVEMVSWVDAIKFCNRLSELQGLDKCYTKNSILEYDWLCDFTKNGYRLPRETEWEYAAKAGTENRWAGTDDESKLGKYAWFDENSNESTHPVKTKLPNEWGFYDMSGNVMEWCWDRKYPMEKPSTKWSGTYSAYLDNYYRVRRGGGWLNDNVASLRSAARNNYSPGDRRGRLGFRVARSIVS